MDIGDVRYGVGVLIVIRDCLQKPYHNILINNRYRLSKLRNSGRKLKII